MPGTIRVLQSGGSVTLQASSLDHLATILRMVAEEGKRLALNEPAITVVNQDSGYTVIVTSN